MIEIIKTGFKLFIITAFAALALGITYEVTKLPIEEQMILARLEAKRVALPQADEFTPIDIEGFKADHPMVIEVYEGKSNSIVKGYTMQVLSRGFADMELIVAIDIDGNIVGINVVRQRETPGLGTKATSVDFVSKFFDLPAKLPFELVKGTPGDNEIQAVSGATTSSGAVVDAVNTAINFYVEVIKEGRI